MDYPHNFIKLKPDLLKDFASLLVYPDFLVKKTNISNKLFLPHVDNIHLIQKKLNNDMSYDNMKNNFLEIMNTLELCKAHKCKFIYYKLYNEEDKLIEKFSSEYAQFEMVNKLSIE